MSRKTVSCSMKLLIEIVAPQNQRRSRSITPLRDFTNVQLLIP
jgi:hypothetical protein